MPAAAARGFRIVRLMSWTHWPPSGGMASVGIGHRFRTRFSVGPRFLNTGFIASWPRFSPLSPGRGSFDLRPTLMRFRALQRKLAALCCSEAAGLRTIPLRRCRAPRHPHIDGGARFALAVFQAPRAGDPHRSTFFNAVRCQPRGQLWVPQHLWLGLIAAWSGVCRVPDSAHGL